MFLGSKMTVRELSVVVASLMILNWGRVDGTDPGLAFISSVPMSTATTTVIDAGQTVTFTCLKSLATVTPTNWIFIKGASTEVQADSTSSTFVITSAATTDDGAYSCKAKHATDISTAISISPITLTVTALSAPTLTTHPTTTSDTVKQTEGQIITFVCKHATGNKAPAEYKFFMGSAADSMTEITTGHSNGIYALKVMKADHDEKKIKCQQYNANTATGKKDSAVLTLSVSAASTCKQSNGNAPTISLCLLLAMAVAPLFSSSRD
ncbi:uncharacterized protein LOC135498434 [Lineus longissimus]|uniref:uncharacterized protein LOC135498434 n=1 Tax=Lineus longissimus TaxID=88925 RepID=UPI002B4E62DE